MHKYTVIIPVFGALEQLKACVDSVLRNTSEENTVFAIDDCSPESETLRYIQRLGYSSRVVVMCHDRNVGFVRTANEGIKQALQWGTDAILLNSDTVVPHGWIERLDLARREAESRGLRVASVHPLSNACSFYSVPNPGDNLLPECVTVDEMDALVEGYSENTFQAVPCAVGFCMLITREAIEAVGLFDTKWGKGYGEETEWSIKAKAAGFSCILADNLFVYHEHHASFGEEANDLRKAAQERFLEEYPLFPEVVQAWFLESPQIEHRVRLANRLRPRKLSSKPPIKVVYVCHHWGKLGGLEIFQRRLVEELKEELEITVLHPTREDMACDGMTYLEGNVLHVVMSPRMTQAEIELGIFPFKFDADHVESWFAKVITTLAPDVVHFQHLGGWGTFRLPEIASAVAKTVLSVHDDFYLCPSYLTAGWSCGRDAAEACKQCVECVNEEMLVRVEGRHSEKTAWRLQHRSNEIDSMFGSCNRVIFPSSVIETRYFKNKRALFANQSIVIPHGVPSFPRVKLPRLTRGKVRVAWVGGVLNEKGWAAFAQLCKDLKDHPTYEFSVYGEWHEQADRSGLSHVQFMRRYSPEQLPQLLERVDVVVPAVARKEAYGLVVDECLACEKITLLPKVPTIEERVSLANWYEWGNAESLKDALFRAVQTAWCLPQIQRTMRECAEEYRELYALLCFGDIPKEESIERDDDGGPW